VNGHIEGLLTTGEQHAPPADVAGWFPIDNQVDFVRRATADPHEFWAHHARSIAWETPPVRTFSGSISDQHWFEGGRLNATVSCLDRHVALHPDAVAYDALSEDGAEHSITYAELLARTNRLANALAADGVAMGDRVCIYMPLTIEGIVAMLACARIGAIHSVVYAGLGAGALSDRIEDAGADVLIVADVTYRRGKVVDLKSIVDEAVQRSARVRRVVVWRRIAAQPLDEREVNLEAYCDNAPAERAATIVPADHPLFILYTSGTTGKPKGVVMTHGGYLVGASTMLHLTTGIASGESTWCTSDIGWIVGHTIIVYGALANRYRNIIREGSPDYPSPGTVYDVLERYRVRTLYTAPTLARMLMRFGPDLLQNNDLSSLRAIFCAGEPLNPEAWHFLFETVGKRAAAVCNQWWQTELAAPTIGFLPSSSIRPDRSGMALGPFVFSVRDIGGVPEQPGKGGLLVLETAAPYMFADIWNDRARYLQYFSAIPDVYTAGDVAIIDADGYISVLGRADDVLNVAGHRLATADVESALVSHHACGEAGVIGVPDEIKGEAIVAYVVLRAGYASTPELATQLGAHVRRELGPIATPSRVEIVATLPKTRSGKIMRRLLRAQATGADIGDVSTLDE
jgi:acetyl-CoA synthetase